MNYCIAGAREATQRACPGLVSVVRGIYGQLELVNGNVTDTD
jgi:hypothetical protein